MKGHLKNYALYFCVFIIFIVLPILITGIFLFGATVFSMNALPWLNLATYFAFGFSLFVLLPLSFFRRTKSFSSYGLILASYIYGINLWCFSFLITLYYWGYLAVILGISIAGIGIIPIALLAVIFNGEWWNVKDMFILLILIIGSRLLGTHISNK